ncbi:MAG: TRAP transporter substrate-binding protein DctP [Spirochaetaceae bacterium]|nr:TRAP transporter substrate-binding protein DctP [Spirochaetaceae bacterium]
MKKVLLFSLFIISIATIFAQEIKIGTVAPTGSLWETTIKEIAAEWSKISNGEIRVKIYSGGTVGDEIDILRKIKLGGLHAAALSTYGIKNISDDLFVLSIPMLIKDDDELDYVLKKMEPTFNKKLQENGFVSLGWTNTGWIRWFSKTKVLYPDDLRQIKLAVDSSDQKAIQIWQRSGFRVIPLSFNDLISGIYSGMAEATYITPYTASSLGITQHIPYMLDMPVSPVYCLLTISERAWKSINDKYKPLIIKRTNEIIGGFYAKIVKIENEGIEVMKKQGFTIVPVTPEALVEWEKVVDNGVDLLKQSFSPQIHSEVRKYIDEYRNK